MFFRISAKQLTLATNENVLGHVAWSRQMKSPTHVSTFLRVVCGLVLAAWAFPTGFFSVPMISGRSFPLIVTLLCNMIQPKVFYISLAEDRCEVITTDENQLLSCDDFMQIVRVLTGTWRNVITCAYLFHVSFRPRGLNSNTFLANGDCSARLWKKSTCFGSKPRSIARFEFKICKPWEFWLQQVIQDWNGKLK